MDNLDLAVIGNCKLAALIDRNASIVWGCFPHFDSDPIFSALVNTAGDDGEYNGIFAIEMIGQTRCEQAYLDNTPILVSTLSDDEGNVLEIVDFSPRYARFERIYRPPMMVRRLRPVQGRPRIRIRLRPSFEWNGVEPELTLGSNHMRFVGPRQVLRLTTDVPLSYIRQERHFVVDGPQSLVFGADEPFGAELEGTTREALDKTSNYWREWVRSLSVPFEWQEAVIRAAITLKLCNFEETGAIVAALTTSLPEAPNTERNWDYRYCWLRDAYFVIHALNRLGATKTMEGYLRYIGNIVSDWDAHGALDLAPLFTITRSGSLEEYIAPDLKGFRGMGPVRVGNAAYTQIQNDAYGAIILASTQIFFDKRLKRPPAHEMFESLERLGHRARAVFDKPDAGPWELRNSSTVHTFSAVMCWAACDRLAKIAAHIGHNDRAQYWREEADHIHATISNRAFNQELGHYVASFDGTEVDATLLLLRELGFLKAEDPHFLSTLAAVESQLKRGDLLLRYAGHDDFGYMSTAFVICTFWYVDALNAVGRRDEACALFDHILSRRNVFGLYSEDVDIETGVLWGNFPQTYSLVGLINSATRLSKPWEDAF